jgi:hypothetical protein
MTIDEQLRAEEVEALNDPILRQAATAALALATKTAPGTHSPSPALPSRLYGDLIAEAGRVDRLRYVAERGERPTGAVGGYFTRNDILADITAVMRRATR